MSKKWNNEIPWTKDSNYILRVIEEKFGPANSSGSLMITLKHEVVAPEEMDVAGEPILIAGVSANLTSYIITKPMKDGEVDTEKAEGKLKDLKAAYELYGVELPAGVEINPENPPLGFKGKLVYAAMDNDLRSMLKTPTKEQLAKGIKVGDPMLHPKTKQPLKENWPKILKVICPAEAPANQPY